MRHLIREPLIHFIALGALVFIGHYVLVSGGTRDAKTVVISEAEVAQRIDAFEMRLGRTASDEDRVRLRDEVIGERVLVAEARRLGLHIGDVGVHARLAQKMTLLLSDTLDVPEPDEKTMRAWFEANQARFDIPARLSFSHIYFNPQTRGEAVDADARLIRDDLLADRTDWQRAGDPFGFAPSYTSISEVEIGRLFGPSFAEALFTLEPETWSEPLPSAFGTHLARVEGISPARPQSFEAVEADVRQAYRDDALRAANAAAITTLIASYDIIMDAGAQ